MNGKPPHTVQELAPEREVAQLAAELIAFREYRWQEARDALLALRKATERQLREVGRQPPEEDAAIASAEEFLKATLSSAAQQWGRKPKKRHLRARVSRVAKAIAKNVTEESLRRAAISIKYDAPGPVIQRAAKWGDSPWKAAQEIVAGSEGVCLRIVQTTSKKSEPGLFAGIETARRDSNE